MTRKNEKLPWDEDGTLPAYAWPGGYPIYYFTADSGILCPTCANAHLDEENEQFEVVDYTINWEDDQVWCDHCNKHIEPAYGD